LPKQIFHGPATYPRREDCGAVQRNAFTSLWAVSDAQGSTGAAEWNVAADFSFGGHHQAREYRYKSDADANRRVGQLWNSAVAFFLD
jgi:hypothetical protein